MISKVITIANAQGLHMRPAGLLTKELAAFKSAVTIKYNGKDYNAKSIMMVMAACIKCGAEVEFVCDGEDEAEALAKIESLVADNFGE
jgi:phosphocarrier protein